MSLKDVCPYATDININLVPLADDEKLNQLFLHKDGLKELFSKLDQQRNHCLADHLYFLKAKHTFKKDPSIPIVLRNPEYLNDLQPNYPRIFAKINSKIDMKAIAGLNESAIDGVIFVAQNKDEANSFISSFMPLNKGNKLVHLEIDISNTQELKEWKALGVDRVHMPGKSIFTKVSF